MKQRHILLLIFFISLIIVLLNDIFLSYIPEIFNSGDKIGQLLSNLSRSYISSYIFYLVVVVLKDKKNKKNIYITVYDLTKNLVGRAYAVYHNIILATGTDSQKFDKRKITKAEFKELCRIANPKDIPQNRFLGSPLNSQQANYGQFIYNNAVSHVKNYTDRIFNYMPFLDSEHVRLINRLNNSTFFLVAEGLNWPTENQDFSVYADNMYEFLEFVRELEDYNETEIKKHI